MFVVNYCSFLFLKFLGVGFGQSEDVLVPNAGCKLQKVIIIITIIIEFSFLFCFVDFVFCFFVWLVLWWDFSCFATLDRKRRSKTMVLQRGMQPPLVGPRGTSSKFR